MDPSADPAKIGSGAHLQIALRRSHIFVGSSAVFKIEIPENRRKRFFELVIFDSFNAKFKIRFGQKIRSADFTSHKHYKTRKNLNQNYDYVITDDSSQNPVDDHILKTNRSNPAPSRKMFQNGGPKSLREVNRKSGGISPAGDGQVILT